MIKFATLREEQGFSNKSKFAELSKISRQYLDKIDKGTASPTLIVVNQFCLVLNLPIDVVAPSIEYHGGAM